MSIDPEKTCLYSAFPDEVITRICTEHERRTCNSAILKSVDASFNHILKLFYGQNQNQTDNDKVLNSLTITIGLQGECIVKVIRDEIIFLESSRKSLPDDFVEENVSVYQHWEEYFLLVVNKPVTASAMSYLRSIQESFMLFMEFYRSVDNVLKTWPIPLGYSYPKVSDKLDVFFDNIPSPPKIAYSLLYRPKIKTEEMKCVIVGEYNKAATYLSKHLENVKEMMALLNLQDTECPFHYRIRLITTRLFTPIQDKLEEYEWKCGEIEKCDYRMDLLQAERVYASEQVLGAYQYAKSLNEDLQAKFTKHLAEFYLSVKRKLSRTRRSVRTSHQCNAITEHNDATKELILNMLWKWEDTLEYVINLNKSGILEIITNVHDLENEITEYAKSLPNCNIK